MRSPTLLAMQLTLAAYLIAVGQNPLDAQYGGPIHAGGFGGGSPPRPVYGAPVDPNAAIEIASEPKVIDPATLLPPEMAAKVTLAFDQTPLSEVVTALKEKLAIDVVLDEVALTDEGIDLNFPVSTRANDEPVYLLLDRMMGRTLAWDFRGGVLRISTQTAAENRLDTRGYELSGLLNAGYSPRQLEQLLSLTSSDSWEFIDCYGGALNFVGDSLIVYQTDKTHREITGILAALQTPARQTFIGQASRNVQLRDFFKNPITVEFLNTPLCDALAAVSELIGSTIQIDGMLLSDNGIAPDTPVSLSLRDKPLGVVLDNLLTPLDLTCVVELGELVITTTTAADDLMAVAIYDVRDICRSDRTSREFLTMIQNTTHGQWEELDGLGGALTFARPGILVVRQTGKMHEEIISLIEDLRTLRRQAEPVGERSWERAIETRFYRVTSSEANYLEQNLPKLIAPGTWRSAEKPDAPGTIEQVSAAPVAVGSPTPSPLKTEKNSEVGETSDAKKPAIPLVDTVVLAIQQTAGVHEEIPYLLHRLQNGDPKYFRFSVLCGYGDFRVNEPSRFGPPLGGAH